MDKSENTAETSELLPQTGEIDPNSDDEPESSLALIVTRFLRNCWQKRRLVFTILAIGISISVVRALLEHNRYTSTTTIMPPDNSSPYANLMSMLSSSGGAAGLGSEMLGLETPGDLFVNILESRSVEDGVIAQCDLARYFDARNLADARKELNGDTNVEQDRKSGMIEVSVTLGDPALAAKVADSYVVELNHVLNESSSSSARRERIFLEGRLKTIKEQLDETSKALSQFSSKSGAIDIQTQARSMVDAGLRLQAELISGRSQLAGLRQTYSADNPRVRAVEARNAELQRQINAMGGRSIRNATADQDSDVSSYPTVSELPTLGLTYYDLERKVQVEEALWEALTRQYEVAKVQEAERTPAARVLDVANVPDRKSGPSRRLEVIIGTLISLVLACVLVVALTVWEEMDAEEEPKKLILEVMGTVMDSRQWYWSLPGFRRLYARLSG